MQMTKRHSTGQNTAQNLLVWLNATKGIPGKSRVVALLQAVQQLRAEREPKRRHKLLLEIFDRFAWYQSRLRLGMTIDPRSENWTVHWKMGQSVAEGDALNALLKLHDENLEQKVRQCRCGRWFFARSGKHNFCSRKCQLKATRSTAAWKKKNREHQRAYRKRNF